METPTLLGHLARFSSFSTQSEVLCTQGLTYILETQGDACSALAEEVAARTGVIIGDSLKWLAEAIQADGGRPDLEACRTVDGVPVVKIEAKLEAELLPEQLQSYVADLRERNSGDAALLVLVPKLRTAEAARVTAKAFNLSGAGPWRVTDGHRTGIAVISWDELFTALRGCKTERLRYELEQLEAMYSVLIGDYIAPLADEEDLRQWRERETDLVDVVDQVTRELTKTTQHQVYPMQREPQEGVTLDSESRHHRFRYVCPIEKSCFSIGVRDSFAGWVTPVWMRFHRNTGNFKQIRQRVEASVPSSIESGGHIWIPLDVPFNVSGEQMIQALVEQAEEVVRVAYQAE